MRSLGFFWLLASIGTPCAAAPLWEKVEVIGGFTVYGDHRDPNVYYYQPAEYQIAASDQAPHVYFRVFRYLGTPETRDTNEFRVAAILTVDAEQATAADRYVEALEALRRRNRGASLRPLPVESFSAQLNYVGIDPGGAEQSGDVDAAASGEVASRVDDTLASWGKRRFTVALDALTAELFWSNFEHDRLQLSLSYRLLSAGMRRNDRGEWERDERTFGGTVPVYISMAEHPEHFSRIETWQLANRRRTDVIVMCYDFLGQEDDELFRVSIDVRFKTLREQEYVETVRFGPEAETEQTVSFRLARNLEEPYFYRVTRMYRSRPVERSDWIEHQGMLLDVSRQAM